MYYFYCPPKSSVWGHGLRKMLPSVLYGRMTSLLSDMDIKIHKETYYLSLSHGFTINDKGSSDDYDKLYCELCNVLDISELVTNPFHILNRNQFDKVLEYLFTIEKNLRKLSAYINLNNSIEISQWTINKNPKRTLSELSVHYGSDPSIGTEFVLNSEEEFEYIKNVFIENNICVLNKKHLRPIKDKKFKL